MHPVMKNISGFGLIEVLVTLLILAIGLLGVAALQYRGLQYSHDAYLRSQINLLIYDIADKMRMNSDQAEAYADKITEWSVPAARPDDCDLVSDDITEGITDEAIVNNDVACWQQQVYDALPPGSTADIAKTVPAGTADPDTADPVYTVTLEWQDRETIPHQVTISFTP